MHLLLEGSDLQELLTEVRETHGNTARVVRAERIRSGGVAGFFSKERYEVTVEMDGSEAAEAHAGDHPGGGAEVPPVGGLQPGARDAEEENVNDEGRTGDTRAETTGAEAVGETREALDFEALLAAADLAESRSRAEQDEPVVAVAGPDAADEPAPAAPPADDFEAARRGLVDMLTASGAVESARAAGLLTEGSADHLDQGQPAARDEAHGEAHGEAHDEDHGYEAQHATRAPEVDLAGTFADLAARQEVAREEAAREEAAARQEQAERDALAEATALAEEQLLEEARREIEQAEREEAQRREAQREEAQRRERARQDASREAAREEQRMRQQEMERAELERAAASRAEERRREDSRTQVRRRQAERVQRPAQPAAERSLGEILAAADAADGSNRLEAMFSAGRQLQAVPAARHEPGPARTAQPHRPISTESESFSRTMAAMRSSAGGRSSAERTPVTGVTADVRSVSRQSMRPERPRPGRPAVADAGNRSAGRFDVQATRTPEDRVSEQYGATNGATSRRPEHVDLPHEGRENPFAARGERVSRRPELRRPAIEDHFGDRFGERAEVEDERVFADEDHGYVEEPHRGLTSVESFPQESFARESRAGEGYGAGAYGRSAHRPQDEDNGAGERAGYDGDDNEAVTMDQTYRDAVTTYSDRSAPARMPYREPQDSTDVLRLARDIEVPAPLRVGSGELVIVVGEADAVVAAALLVADEVGSEAPLVLGRADVQNTITADELPARQEQARRWSAPLTIAIPARPTAADAERAARVAAEVGAASVVVCVDATRRSHAVASLLRALEVNGVPARRLAVHRAAESPDPLDVLSLDVPVGFLDGRPATSGAWAGLLLDATSEHGPR